MNVVLLKGAKEAPKSERSLMQTEIITKELVESWQIPTWCQRPLKVNSKVRDLADEIKRDGCAIKGVLTLGKIKGDPATYIVDGQHRLEAFKLSGLEEIIADMWIMHFDTRAELAEEFVLLQTPLVRMNPDDVLRGMESNIQALQQIRKACPFVGYDNIRRGAASPVLSMSALLKCWLGSRGETPTLTGGKSSRQHAEEIDEQEVERLVEFLQIAYSAWGREPEHFRLWSSLNLTMCMWVYRQIVIQRDRSDKRSVTINATQFKQCAMFVSSSQDYLDFLLGRTMGERDRSPCYTRLRALFIQRLQIEMKDKKVKMPAPPWFRGERRDQ